MRSRCCETFHSALQNHPAYFSVFAFCPYNSNVSNRGVGNPHLGTIQKIMVALVCEFGFHRRRVGTVVRFCQTKTSNHIARSQLGKIFSFLFLRTILENRKHHQRRLYRSRRTHCRISSFQFLHYQSIRDLIQPRTAIFLRNVWTKRPDISQFFHQSGDIRMILCCFIYLWHYKTLHPASYRITDKLVFFGQKSVYGVIIWYA